MRSTQAGAAKADHGPVTAGGVYVVILGDSLNLGTDNVSTRPR